MKQELTQAQKEALARVVGASGRSIESLELYGVKRETVSALTKRGLISARIRKDGWKVVSPTQKGRNIARRVGFDAPLPHTFARPSRFITWNRVAADHYMSECGRFHIVAHDLRGGLPGKYHIWDEQIRPHVHAADTVDEGKAIARARLRVTDAQYERAQNAKRLISERKNLEREEAWGSRMKELRHEYEMFNLRRDNCGLFTRFF